MKVRLIFAWYDLWVGLFWDRGKKRLYILPIPMVGVVLDFSKPTPIPGFNSWQDSHEHPGVR